MSGPVSTVDAAAVSERSHELSDPALEHLESRSTDVGGVPVRRALPRRRRRTVGAWCFVDHFGPVTAEEASMQIGAHPHLGLQTVTWVLEGEVRHSDSLGSEQLIRPGQLNLMTAGNGVAHSEEQRPFAPLHGVQLWIAQPEATRHGEPAFEHHGELPQVEFDNLDVTVLIGDLDGQTSPARADTPLAGFAVTARSGTSVVPLRPDFEYAVVAFTGKASIDDDLIVPGELVYLGCGRDELHLGSPDSADLLIIGGSPFHEELLMWWNFVARTREEISEAVREWQEESDRFGEVDTALHRIDAPKVEWIGRG